MNDNHQESNFTATSSDYTVLSGEPELTTNSSRHPAELIRAAEALKQGDVPDKVTVRTLLSWFQAQRRGSFITWYIRNVMNALGIKTVPDFNAVWIDSEISFVPATYEEKGNTATADTSESVSESTTSIAEVTSARSAASYVGGAIDDPTYRIGKLAAANQRILFVSPNYSIAQAVTHMLV